MADVEPLVKQLSPIEVPAYKLGESNARKRYAMNLAQTSYQRGQAENQYARNRAFLTQQWNKTRNQLPGNFLARGVYGSGVWRDRLLNYADERSKSFEDLQLGHQQTLQGFDYTDLLANQELDETLAGVINTILGRRSEAASNVGLRGL